MSSEGIGALVAEMLAGLEGVQGGPYKLDARASYIWAPSAKGGDFPVGDYVGRDDDGIPVMRLRGWGYYTGKGHGALGLSADEAETIQRRTGEHLARCSPDNIRRLATALVAQDAEIAALRMALEPFAKMADQVDEWQTGTDPDFAAHFDANDIRRARALTRKEG